MRDPATAEDDASFPSELSTVQPRPAAAGRPLKPADDVEVISIAALLARGAIALSISAATLGASLIVLSHPRGARHRTGEGGCVAVQLAPAFSPEPSPLPVAVRTVFDVRPNAAQAVALQPVVALLSTTAAAVEPLPSISRVQPPPPETVQMPATEPAHVLDTSSAGETPGPVPPAPVAPAPVTPAAPAPVAPVRTSAPDSPIDVKGDVRNVLDRYRAAYGTLSASAVESIWPTVNARALGRAFLQIESQQLTFDDCRIDLSGLTALAFCTGTASYVPKIGSHTARAESRHWTFRLGSVDGRWIIEDVESR